MAHPYRFDANRTWLPLAASKSVKHHNFQHRSSYADTSGLTFGWSNGVGGWSFFDFCNGTASWLSSKVRNAEKIKSWAHLCGFRLPGSGAQHKLERARASWHGYIPQPPSHPLCFPNTFTVTIPLSSPQGWIAGFQRGWGGNVWEETRKPWDLMKRRDGWIMMDGCNISQCFSWRQSWRFMAGRGGRQALRPMRSRMRQWRCFPKSQWNGMEFRSGGKFSVVCLDDSFTKKARYLMLVPGQHNRWKRGMWRSDRNS